MMLSWGSSHWSNDFSSNGGFVECRKIIRRMNYSPKIFRRKTFRRQFFGRKIFRRKILRRNLLK